MYYSSFKAFIRYATSPLSSPSSIESFYESSFIIIFISAKNGCYKHYYALILFLGSLSSIFFNKSIAVGGAYNNYFYVKSILASLFYLTTVP